MATEVKAVVFKTQFLKEIKEFYTCTLGLKILESSKNHFVIFSKGLRLLFVSSNQDFEVELYLHDIVRRVIKKNRAKQSNSSRAGLFVLEDLNKIKVFVSREIVKK